MTLFVHCTTYLNYVFSDTVYTERYMGMPDENKEAYDVSNLDLCYTLSLSLSLSLSIYIYIYIYIERERERERVRGRYERIVHL